MLDRQKLETLLSRRFPGASEDQVATAANAIMGLGDEWEEVLGQDEELAHHFSSQCGDECFLVRELERGAEFRLLRRHGA